MIQDPCQIIGVSGDATQEEIKRALLLFKSRSDKMTEKDMSDIEGSMKELGADSDNFRRIADDLCRGAFVLLWYVSYVIKEYLEKATGEFCFSGSDEATG